ncbi:ABC transporter substrate-binding protein [Arthrobacter sp. NPDC057259]|uniref:ABC transporter substrate-binding protein n=1 Tax=Arthrobacter sp. NPDC057259 TaxID=3346073 RepID=UPI00363F7E84
MSHPIDVGSVLGGRYKVTATVLTSHDEDLVLDGVDQVLNRPVSILVAGPGNADQVAQSAREVATGERPGQVQILDLGVSDDATYLITNHTSAADLLDLVVSSNPPYVEPFFTDTLGSEIFGQARSNEPETYDGLYDDEEVDAGYINYGDQQQRPATQPVVPPRQAPAPPAAAPKTEHRGAGAAAAAGVAGAAAGAAAAKAAKPSKSPKTAPQDAAPQPTVANPVQPAQSAKSAPTSSNPKVSLWQDDDYDDAVPDQRMMAREKSSGPAAGRAAATLPAFARKPAADGPGDYDDEDDEAPRREPRSMRWLVGALLAAVLVIGLIFAVTNLGGLFKGGTPQAAKTTSTSTGTGTPEQSGTPSTSQSAPPAAVPPAIESVSRQGNFDFAATYDGDLVKTYDGNAASYWSDMEFATDAWGGFAPDGVPLVVKLKGPAKVSSVTLSQLGASGGNISVYTADQPSLDGAKLVGSNSFTSPELTLPLQEPVTAQYVIIQIKNLPKLAAPKTRYGFGLRLAEIKVQ